MLAVLLTRGRLVCLVIQSHAENSSAASAADQRYGSGGGAAAAPVLAEYGSPAGVAGGVSDDDDDDELPQSGLSSLDSQASARAAPQRTFTAFLVTLNALDNSGGEYMVMADDAKLVDARLRPLLTHSLPVV